MKKKNISWVNQPNATRDSSIELELCFTLMLFQGSFLAMKKMSCKRKKLSKVMKFMITQITRISIIINWKLRWNICIIDADVLSKVFYELLCNFLHQSPSSYLEVSISWKKKNSDDLTEKSIDHCTVVVWPCY